MKLNVRLFIKQQQCIQLGRRKFSDASPRKGTDRAIANELETTNDLDFDSGARLHIKNCARLVVEEEKLVFYHCLKSRNNGTVKPLEHKAKTLSIEENVCGLYFEFAGTLRNLPPQQ